MVAGTHVCIVYGVNMLYTDRQVLWLFTGTAAVCAGRVKKYGRYNHKTAAASSSSKQSVPELLYPL